MARTSRKHAAGARRIFGHWLAIFRVVPITALPAAQKLPAVSLAVEVDFAGEGVDLGGQRVGVGLALGGLGVVDGGDLGAQLG